MTRKIWSSNNTNINNEISDLLSYDDIKLDNNIFIYDIESTIAHTEGLFNIGIISNEELIKIKNSLEKLEKEYLSGKFKLTNQFEDCHSAIEFYLIDKIGEAGKKVHTVRSRNDQVITAIRLYSLDQLNDLKQICINITKSFLDKAARHKKDIMPGYTHLQRAMPSSWGLWFSSYAESFIDSIDLLEKTYDWINSNPLGSAAGYGVSIPLDREFVSSKLNFNRLQNNSLYVQNSRGKYELQIIASLKQIMLDIRKIAWDLSLFLSKEFDLIAIDKKYCTGSSIMPNKLNPDVIEILRANYSILAGLSSELENILSLPSGYHRDLQLTKKSLIGAFAIVKKSSKVIPDLIKTLEINHIKSKEMVDDDMLMTERVFDLVNIGYPFRDAYHEIKNNNFDQSQNKESKKYSLGSPNNLNLEFLADRLKKHT